MAASSEDIVYRSTQEDLPDYLPWFVIPVPKAFFTAIFKSRVENKRPYFTSDAYLFEVGDIFYSSPEASAECSPWDNALKTLAFQVQVIDVRDKGQPWGRVDLSIFTPDPEKTAVRNVGAVTTTQANVLALLRTGDLREIGFTPLQEGEP